MIIVCHFLVHYYRYYLHEPILSVLFSLLTFHLLLK